MVNDPSIQRSRFDLHAGGHRLAVVTLNPPLVRSQGPTLVFLHEGLGSIAQWQDFPGKLSQALALPALLYDRWGFGGSEPLTLPRPIDYLEREAEQALPELLDACGISVPILVGHSDGATIALLFASAFPGRCRALVSIAAHVIVEPITLSGIRRAQQAWQDGKLRTALARYHGDKTDRVFHGWADTWLRPEFANWQMLDRLSTIRAPVLALQGESDQYGTSEQLALIERSVGGPVQTCLLADCAHAPHLEAPAETLSSICSFLTAVLGPEGSQ